MPADLDVSLEVRPQGFVQGTRAAAAATQELTDRTRESGAATRETTSAEDRLAEAERRRVQAASELIRSYKQRISALAEYQRQLAAGASLEASQASRQVSATGVDPNSRLGAAMQALIEKERVLRGAVAETAAEIARTDQVTGNIAALQRRTQELQVALEVARQGVNAERAYAEAEQVRLAIEATGARPGSDHAAAVVRETQAQQRLAEELAVVARARERDELAAREEDAQRTRVADEVARLRETTSQLGILAAAHRKDATAVREANIQLEVRNTLLRAGVAAGSADAQIIEQEIRAQAAFRQQIDQSTAAKRRATEGVFSLRNAFYALQGIIATLGLTALIRDAVGVALALDRANKALVAVTGSQTGAAQEMAFVRGEADRLGLVLTDTAQSYASLAAASKGTALEGQAARDIFSAVAEASTVMGLSADQANGALLAIQQMMSKGTVQAEELRGQLGERLPGAFQLAARAMGTTTAGLGKMLETGKVTAADMLPKLAAELRKTFGPGLANALNSAQANLNRFRNDLDQLKGALGTGFLEGFLAGFKDLRGALTDGELKQAARDLGQNIGSALRIAADAAGFLAKNLELVKAALIAILALKVAAGFVSLATAIAGATGATVAFIGVASNLALATGLGAIAIALLALIVVMEKYISSTRLEMQAELERVDKSQQLFSYYATLKANKVGLTEAEWAYGKQVRATMEAERAALVVALARAKAEAATYQFAPSPGFAPADQGRQNKVTDLEREVRNVDSQLKILDSQWMRLANLPTIKVPVDGSQLDKTGQKIADLLQKFRMGAEEAERLARAELGGADAAYREQQAIEREKGAWEALHQIHGLSATQLQRLTAIIETYIGREQQAKDAIAATAAARERNISYNEEAQRAEAALADAISNTTARGREMAAQLQAEAVARAEHRSEDAAYIASLKAEFEAHAQHLAGLQVEIEWINRQREAQAQQRQLEAELTDARRQDTQATMALAVALEAEAEVRQRGLALGPFEYQVLLAIIGARVKAAAATKAQTAAQQQLNAYEVEASRARANLADTQARVDLAARYGSAVADLAVQLGAASEAERKLRIEEEVRAEATRQGAAADKAAIRAKIIAQEQELGGLAGSAKLIELKAAVYQPLHDAWQGALAIGLDVLKKWVTTGKISAKEIAASLLELLVNVFGEILQRWITLQLAMKAAQIGGSAGSPASWASLLSQGRGGGNGGGVTLGSNASAGYTDFGSTAATGTAGYTATGGSLAGWAVVAIYVAIVVAVVAFILNWVKVHRSTRAGIDLAVKDGKFAVGEMKGVDERLKLLKDGVISPLVKQLNDFVKSLGGTVDGLAGTMGITRSGRSKNTKYTVYVHPEAFTDYTQGFGNDAAAAMQYAFYRALQIVKFAPGLDPIVQRAVQAAAKRAADAMYRGITDAEKKAIQEEFDRLTGEAQQVARMGKPEQVQQLNALSQSVDQLVADMLMLLGPSAEFDQAVKNITLDMVQQLQSQRDAITGRQRTAEEEYQSRLRAMVLWNAELALRKLDLQQRIVDMKIKVTDAEVTLANAQAQATHARVAISAGRALGDAAENLAETVAAAGGMTAAQLAAMKANLAALEAILAALPDAIQESEVQRSGGTRGSGKPTAAEDQKNLRQMLQDAAWADKLRKMSDYGKGVAEINKKWDEAIPLAHGNKLLLQEIARARQAEIAALREQEREKLKQELRPYLQDFGKGQFQIKFEELARQMAEARKRAKELGMSIEDVDLAARNANKALGQEAIASLGLPIEQTIAQFEALEKTLAFLRTNAKELQLTDEDLARVTRELGDQLYMSLVDALLKYVDDEKIKRDLVELRYQMEIANIRLQFELAKKLGLLTQKQIDLIDGLIKKLPEHAPASDSGVTTGGKRAPAASAQDAARQADEAARARADAEKRLVGYEDLRLSPMQVEIKRVNEEFASLRDILGNTVRVQTAYNLAIQDVMNRFLQPIRDLQKSLSLSEFSPLKAMQRLNTAQQQFQASLAALQGGDLNQLEVISGYAQTYLQEALAALPKGSTAYTQIYDQVNAALAGILAKYGQQPASGAAPDGGAPPSPQINLDPVTTQIQTASEAQLVELREIKRNTGETKAEVYQLRRRLDEPVPIFEKVS